MKRIYIIEDPMEYGTAFFVPELLEQVSARAKSKLMTNIPGVNYAGTPEELLKLALSPEYDDYYFVIDTNYPDKPYNFKNPHRISYRCYKFMFWREDDTEYCTTLFTCNKGKKAEKFQVYQGETLLDVINDVLLMVDRILCPEFEEAYW